MNKVTKIFRVACAALAGAALLTAAGCSNLFENVEKDGGSALAAGQAAGKAVLSVSVGSGARTLLPAGIDFDADGLTFTLSGAREGGASKELGEWSDSGDTKACANMAAASVSIDTGSWSFALKVSKDSGEVLYGNAEKKIEAGKNEISFGTLSESSGENAADGNVSLVLSFPAGKVKSAEGVIYTLEDGPGAAEAKTLEITGGEGADSVTFTENAEAGTYIIKITLYTDDAKTSKTVYTELAVVAPGAESKAERTLDSLNELYTVTYELNGGSFAEGENIRTSYSASETFALPVPERKGYTFAGWAKAEGGEKAYDSGEEIKMAEDTALYALWTLDTYTIKYELDGGSFADGVTAPESYTVDDEVELPELLPPGRSSVFAGWYESEDFSTARVAGWKAGAKTGNVTLYARWGTAVTADNIVETIKSMTESGALKATGTFNSSLISKINSALKRLGSGVLVSLDLSDAEGLTELESAGNSDKDKNKSFYGCENLSGIVLPDSVTSIGRYAFHGCSGLTSIEIGNSVTSIGEGSFWCCSGLTSIRIPDSVTSIGEGAFWNCSSLTSVEIPDSVTSIGGAAFHGCSSLTSIEIPDSVTKIEGSVFSSCSNLKSVVIGNGVTSIGKEAFDSCTGLTSIEIPDSVTSIGYDAFDGCKKIEEISIPSIKYLSNFDKSKLKKVVIRGGDSIGENAFKECGDLKSVVIGNGVTSIEDEAFEYCYGLTSIEIPDSVTSIGGSAFYGCSSLTSIKIPNSVKSIGNYAFDKCENLEISIPSMKCLPEKFFYYASNARISKIVIRGGGKIEKFNLRCTSVVIGNGVTSIGDKAFNGCSLKSIEIPASVTSIGSSAFHGCSSLTSIKIPNSVTSIEMGTFQRCSALTSIEIPDSVTSIGSQAFEYCSGLTSVEIPDSVTIIGEYAFYECSGLTSVVIGNGVTSIGCNAFHGCSNLESAIFKQPNSWSRTYDNYLSFSNPSTAAQFLKKVDYSSANPWTRKDK